MALFGGRDVSQTETAICVVDATGQPVWQGKCAAAPDATAATVQTHAPGAIRSEGRRSRCRLGTGLGSGAPADRGRGGSATIRAHWRSAPWSGTGRSRSRRWRMAPLSPAV
jgi:hypothetical protein